MSISTVNFRDKAVKCISIGYDWECAKNYASIEILENDNSVNLYKITGLYKYALFEDFSGMIISHCKLIENNESVYLSLDPYDESETEDERDNFCFWGKELIKI